MDSHSFNSQADVLESSSRPESHRLFTYYHPQYQPDCPPIYQDDQYASFIFDDRECVGESAYHLSSMNFSTGFDLNCGYVTLSTPGAPEQPFAQQHTVTIPPGKVSTYSELMPHVVAHKATISLKQDVRVAIKPQPCVSPALCQGHADLPECAEFDDELDCPGEPADDFVEYSDEEEDDNHPPPPSPSPSPPPFRSFSYSEPSRTSRAIRSGRTQNRYSPMAVKASPPRKRKSVTQRVSFGSDDEEPKPKKRREAVSLACFFCRKRKIACRQPPEGGADRTCNQCKSRGMECEYPTESRRGARRDSTAHP